MNVLIDVLLTVLVFAVIIIIHEGGHFLMARPVSYTHLDVYKRQL